jgi:hypothetical protein
MPQSNSWRDLIRLVLFTFAAWALWALGKNAKAGAVDETETTETTRKRSGFSKRRLATSLAFATLFFGGAAFSAGAGDVVAEAASAELELDVPDPISFDEAAAAALPEGDRKSVFPECFVCGWTREDGMRIYAGPVEGRDLVGVGDLVEVEQVDDVAFFEADLAVLEPVDLPFRGPDGLAGLFAGQAHLGPQPPQLGPDQHPLDGRTAHRLSALGHRFPR